MIVPAKCKLEKVVSKDQTRPVLASAYLRVVEPATEAEPGSGYLEATDSFKLARVPVELEVGDVEGFIPPAALIEARKADRLTPRLEANGTCDVPGGPSFPRPEPGQPVNVDQLLPVEDDLHSFEVGLSPKLLLELAQGMGAEGGVRLRFCKGRGAESWTPDNPESEPSTRRPIVVRPLGSSDVPDAVGLLMPIKLG
jgi:hypothetical protein